MEEKAKIICKSNFKNSDKTMIAAEFTEKVAKLISRVENLSASQVETLSFPTEDIEKRPDLC